MDPVFDPAVMLVGRRGRWRRRVTQADFDRFAAVSGDDNPIHVDAEFARSTRFGRTLAHGMFLYALVVRHVVNELVPGAVELEDALVFPGPTFAGDELTIDAEVVRVDRALGRVEVRTRVSVNGGTSCDVYTLLAADV